MAKSSRAVRSKLTELQSSIDRGEYHLAYAALIAVHDTIGTWPAGANPANGGKFVTLNVSLPMVCGGWGIISCQSFSIQGFEREKGESQTYQKGISTQPTF